MGKMEQISAERRREENIKKSMEFQMQIGLTRIAENDVVSLPEKKFRQEEYMLKAKILKLHLGDQKELKNESKTKEIEMKKRRKGFYPLMTAIDFFLTDGWG